MHIELKFEIRFEFSDYQILLKNNGIKSFTSRKSWLHDGIVLEVEVFQNE